MKKMTYTGLLRQVMGKISLFETPGEVDDLLSKAVSLLMEKDGASMGAAYVYNERKKKLIFRAGYDRGNLLKSCNCHGYETPKNFALDDNVIGQTFIDGGICILRYNGERNKDRPFKSKILIPIMRGPDKIGIFVLAHKDPNAFDNVDKANLKKATAILGDILYEASVLLDNPAEELTPEICSVPRVIKGLKTSSGTVLGKALPIWADMDRAAEHLPPKGSVKEELSLFDYTVARSREQLENLTQSTATGDTEMVSLIFTAQLLMLKDEGFHGKMRCQIEEGQAASDAVRNVINEYVNIFSSMEEARLAEKAQDVRDLGFRLISNMGRQKEDNFSYRDRIVISRHIYPSDLYRLSVEGVAGVVLRGSGITAHISILARSLNLPVLISDDKTLLSIPEGTPLLLDVDGSKLYINPDKATSAAILEEKAKKKERGVFTVKGRTADGTDVKVMANINLLRDTREAAKQGAEGIGLYRSEFPFILKNDFLSEEQQYRIYRSIVKSQNGKPLVLRTADIGGDKLLQGRSEEESNPFLGVRGIRFSLANRAMFHDQIKAMLRAGVGADLRIMFPMVSDVEEVIQAKEEIVLCMNQLRLGGVAHNDHPKIGAMIELPSAALSVAELAEETDFLSIGSNDLTMYLLAVDRTNEKLSHLYRSHHPTVLRVLASIIREAEKSGRDLSVCGDIASDPFMIPFLVGLGVRNLSVNPQAVEAVKSTLNQLTLKEMEETAREMLSIKKLSGMEKYRNSSNGKP